MPYTLSRALCALVAAAVILPISSVAVAEEAAGRKIEEVIVTAERKEASIQDTSISISAFTDQFLDDFGIRNQEDLQNYIPATTIQPYDLSVRGVGRLYRALGGDPGVATYFDGAYSEDFGIASTEGGLFDLERIEVLRGVQTLAYGGGGPGGAGGHPDRDKSVDTGSTQPCRTLHQRDLGTSARGRESSPQWRRSSVIRRRPRRPLPSR